MATFNYLPLYAASLLMIFNAYTEGNIYGDSSADSLDSRKLVSRDLSGSEIWSNINDHIEGMLEEREGTEISRAIASDVMDIITDQTASGTVTETLTTTVNTMTDSTGQQSLTEFFDGVADIMVSKDAQQSVTTWIAGAQMLATHENIPKMIIALGDIGIKLLPLPNMMKNVKLLRQYTQRIIDENGKPELVKRMFLNLKKYITEKTKSLVVQNFKKALVGK